MNPAMITCLGTQTQSDSVPSFLISVDILSVTRNANNSFSDFRVPPYSHASPHFSITWVTAYHMELHLHPGMSPSRLGISSSRSIPSPLEQYFPRDLPAMPIVMQVPALLHKVYAENLKWRQINIHHFSREILTLPGQPASRVPSKSSLPGVASQQSVHATP